MRRAGGKHEERRRPLPGVSVPLMHDALSSSVCVAFATRRSTHEDMTITTTTTTTTTCLGFDRCRGTLPRARPRYNNICVHSSRFLKRARERSLVIIVITHSHHDTSQRTVDWWLFIVPSHRLVPSDASSSRRVQSVLSLRGVTASPSRRSS